MAKYIFITGGVVSSLGKGIAAASIGCLLESRGLKGRTTTAQANGLGPTAHSRFVASPEGAK